MKINVKGPIVSSSDHWIYKWLGIEATSPQQVDRLILDANGEDLEVEINSGGGSVFAGSEIYTALKSYKGNVTVKIVGIAASAASVIAMAGNKVIMSPTAQMMIHNASARAEGDYRNMNNASKMLKNTNETIASSYRIKSRMSEEELLKMMDDQTWLTPKQALECKLIDEIMFENEFDMVASVDSSGMLPKTVIDRLRNTIKNPDEEEPELDNAKQDEVTNKLKELDLILKLR